MNEGLRNTEASDKSQSVLALDAWIEMHDKHGMTCRAAPAMVGLSRTGVVSNRSAVVSNGRLIAAQPLVQRCPAQDTTSINVLQQALTVQEHAEQYWLLPGVHASCAEHASGRMR
jgi:hypothetical protein